MLSRELLEALDALDRALVDEGPEPGYHRQVLRRTEQEWPTLMRAVRAVLASPEAQRVTQRA